MIAYNVFQSREQGLYCAVPEDQPVPAFIVGESWEFSDKFAEEELPKTAPEVIRFTSFFLFHPFETDKLAA
jgi:hypothetical protein